MEVCYLEVMHKRYVCDCLPITYLFIDSHLFPTEASISSVRSLADPVNIIPDDKFQQGIWFISYQHHPHYFLCF